MRQSKPPLHVALDRRSRVPMNRQIYASIRDAIRAGRLAARTRLPASRVLARDLSVSRTTVVLAYEQLEAEGYITGRRSAGSFVEDLPLESLAPRNRARSALDPSQEQVARRLVALARQAAGPPHVHAAPVPFRIGEPALDLFPARLWARLYSKQTRRSAGSPLGYGGVGGYLPLRAAIADYVRSTRAVNTSADQVIITRGAQQAIHLAVRVLLAPGDRVWVEDPGYLTARAIFQSAGAAVVPVPVDAEGLIVSDGMARAPRARLAYVAPSHQFPLGATMTLARRLALLEWASRSGAWVLEDDYDSEFRYAGPPLASLQGLDTAERVVYIGTFSKTMFPALRLGYAIVPSALADAFLAAQALVDHVAPTFEQMALREFIEDGHFSRHVRRMRAEYASRQEALLAGISRELEGLVHAAPAEAGMHVVGWLSSRGADAAAISNRARADGVEAAPLSAWTMAAPRPPALLLGFAAVRPRTMPAALAILRRAIAPRAR
jgi:GntR family transcriptional regulator/MocR family aminotransferase